MSKTKRKSVSMVQAIPQRVGPPLCLKCLRSMAPLYSRETGEFYWGCVGCAADLTVLLDMTDYFHRRAMPWTARLIETRYKDLLDGRIYTLT
jgi:hypothetical protein